jgi:hypothetical protein
LLEGLSFYAGKIVFVIKTILEAIYLCQMSAKTIFIIIVTVLVTIVLMNNTDEVSFWIFGDAEIPKLAILGVMFGLGLIVGYLTGRPKKKDETPEPYADYKPAKEEKPALNEEDRDYIN